MSSVSIADPKARLWRDMLCPPILVARLTLAGTAAGAEVVTMAVER